MKTGEDKLRLALYLLNSVDDLLFPLEYRRVIDDDIRNYIMEAINEIEELLENKGELKKYGILHGKEELYS